MELFFGPLFFLIFIVVGFSSRVFNRQRRRNLWRAFAQRYGGTFFESQARLSSTGDYVSLLLDGFEVRLDHYVVSHGKNSTTYQRATVDAGSYAGFSAQIYKETPLFSKLGKAFGGQDIEIGHPEFDEAFIIKSDSPARLTQSLNQDAVQEHLRQRHMRVELDGRALTVVCVGLSSDHDALLTQLRLATRYASSFFGGPKKLLADAAHVDAQDAPPNAAW